MRILVTGATGYIGTGLCRKWAADGHELRAVVRSTSQTHELEALGVRCFVGDVVERSSMREAMSGADWVVHAAAELDFQVPEERMRRINVDGSRNIATLAWKLGVGRFLSVSSMACFGGSPADGTPSDESAPPQLPFPSPYSATKFDGEQAIQKVAKEGLRVNTVYPSMVYGPPGKRRGANAMLRMIIKGRLPAVVGGDRVLRWVFVDDLVEGIVRVMDRAQPGEGYFLTGDSITVERLVEKVCRLAHQRIPRWKLSPRMAEAALAAVGPYYRLRGWRAPLNRYQLRTMRRHWNFDDSLARRKLDWHPRKLNQGLPPTVEHLQST